MSLRVSPTVAHRRPPSPTASHLLSPSLIPGNVLKDFDLERKAKSEFDASETLICGSQAVTNLFIYMAQVGALARIHRAHIPSLSISPLVTRGFMPIAT